MRFPRQRKSQALQVLLVLLVLWLTFALLLNGNYDLVGMAYYYMHYTPYLVDMDNFSYILENNVCRVSTGPMLAVLVIVSVPEHQVVRQSHRKALPQQVLLELGMRRIFLLGNPLQATVMQRLQQEQLSHHDLLVGSFQDGPNTLVYKHIMGLRWTVVDCAKAKYIIKVEEDIIYDPYWIMHFIAVLGSKMDRSQLLAGFVQNDLAELPTTSKRLYNTDIGMPNIEPKGYLLGWFYITSRATVTKLLRMSYDTPQYGNDDIWVTGDMRERAEISMTPLNWWFAMDAELLRCCVMDLQRIPPLECERPIGPSEGDMELLVNFQQSMRKCYNSSCEPRQIHTDMSVTCNSSEPNVLAVDFRKLVNSPYSQEATP